MDRPDDPRRDQQSAVNLRVSDADRDQAAAELGEHYQAGRLDQEEFDERLTAALRARTRGELDQLLDDLPAARRPDPPLPSGHAAAGPGFRPLLAALIPLALVVGVVAASSHGRDGAGPWPLLWLWWIIVPAVIFRMRRGWGPRGSGPGSSGPGSSGR